MSRDCPSFLSHPSEQRETGASGMVGSGGDITCEYAPTRLRYFSWANLAIARPLERHRPARGVTPATGVRRGPSRAVYLGRDADMGVMPGHGFDSR
jgi:hypothetical protein